MALLQIQSITKVYAPHTTAVDGVSLAISEGEIVCLLGPSGCGKTTLLRLVAGLEKPDAGRILFEGRDMAAVPPHERGFGMMFQEFALFPHKNVFENIAFGLRMRGDSAAQIRQGVDEMLALVALSGYGEREIDQLSGGERQRVALARSLATNPRLLMLDEPLGALDRALRERLMVDLRQILKEVGVTAVYVTHDQTEAFAIADRVVVMNAGHIEQVDPPETLYARPQTPFVARFIGFRNLLEGEVTTAGVATACGSLAVSDVVQEEGERVTVLIKPDAVVPAQTDGENRLRVEVTAVSFRGRYYEVWGRANEHSLVFEMDSVDEIQIGSQVDLSIDPDKILLL